MGQKWTSPGTDENEVEELIALAADRRLALRDVRTMEAKLLGKYHPYINEFRLRD